MLGKLDGRGIPGKEGGQVFLNNGPLLFGAAQMEQESGEDEAVLLLVVVEQGVRSIVLVHVFRVGLTAEAGRQLVPDCCHELVESLRPVWSQIGHREKRKDEDRGSELGCKLH